MCKVSDDVQFVFCWLQVHNNGIDREALLQTPERSLEEEAALMSVLQR